MVVVTETFLLEQPTFWNHFMVHPQSPAAPPAPSCGFCMHEANIIIEHVVMFKSSLKDSSHHILPPCSTTLSNVSNVPWIDPDCWLDLWATAMMLALEVGTLNFGVAPSYDHMKLMVGHWWLCHP